MIGQLAISAAMTFAGLSDAGGYAALRPSPVPVELADFKLAPPAPAPAPQPAAAAPAAPGTAPAPTEVPRKAGAADAASTVVRPAPLTTATPSPKASDRGTTGASRSRLPCSDELLDLSLGDDARHSAQGGAKSCD